MDVITAIHTRRSIRAYTPAPVVRALLEQVILDAAQTPPPFRGQVPWTFNVATGTDHIAALGQAAMRHARAIRGDEPGWDWLDRPGMDIFWGAPALIVISGPQADCCRAGQTLMLAAHARGLGTCWVGAPLPWLRTAPGRAALAIPPDLAPQVAMCIGHPRDLPDPDPKPRPPIIWSG